MFYDFSPQLLINVKEVSFTLLVVYALSQSSFILVEEVFPHPHFMNGGDDKKEGVIHKLL